MANASSRPRPSSTASYPFNLDSADLILRSCDSINFHVHRAVLAIASPFFATMFQLPPPENSDSTGEGAPSHSVVDVSEDSRTLDTLLRLCYPVDKAALESVDDFVRALKAALKYEMQFPVSLVRKELESAAFRGRPLRRWVVASRVGLEDLAVAMAASLVAECSDGDQEIDVPTMIDNEGPGVLDGVSAGDYFRLIHFVRKRGKVDSGFRLLSPKMPEASGGIDVEAEQDQAEETSLFSSDIAFPDFVCRSSDGVEFQAHRAILALHIPALRSGYASGLHPIPPPIGDNPSGAEDAEGQERPQAVRAPGQIYTQGTPSATLPPSFTFETDAQSLSAVLAICYGGTGPQPLPVLAKVLTLCGLHHMKTAQAVAERLWDQQAQKCPLYAYLLAIQHRLDPYARSAARLLLCQGHLKAAYTPSMETATAQVYHRLVTYVRTCHRVVSQELKEAQDALRCSEAFDDSLPAVAKMRAPNQASLIQYLDRVAGDLQRDLGLGDGFLQRVGALELVRRAFSSSSRLDKVVHEVHKIGDNLVRRLAEAIDRIRRNQLSTEIDRFSPPCGVISMTLQASMRTPCGSAAVNTPPASGKQALHIFTLYLALGEGGGQQMEHALASPGGASSAASHPFNFDNADIIIRSCDHVDFYVHRTVLAVASPVFATMFQLPQPSNGGDPGEHIPPPVVDVSEDSRTLDSLLRLCYPVRKNDSEPYDKVALVLLAVLKYEMEWSLPLIEKELASRSSPLRTWVVGCRASCEEIARAAATSLVANSSVTDGMQHLHTIIESEGPDILEGISAANYFRMIQLIQKRGEVDHDFRMVSPTCSGSLRETGVAGAGQYTPTTFSTDIPSPDFLCRSSDATPIDAPRPICAKDAKRAASSDWNSEDLVGALSVAQRRRPVNNDPPIADRLELPQKRPRLDESAHDAPPASPSSSLNFQTDAQTLSALLAICYGETAPPSLPILAKVLALCDTHEMKMAKGIAEQLWDRKAHSDPLYAYFVAVKHRLVPYARAAARRLFSQGPVVGQYDPCLESESALVYHRLSQYLCACERAVSEELIRARDDWRRSAAYQGTEVRRKRIATQEWLIQLFAKSLDSHSN
ncbi:hypothetical protein OH77DRAFT_1438737 [Trametes cingulata]|nr:hypothetical protein OH77DRAFT_1438737 [Trametes cingulata]